MSKLDFTYKQIEEMGFTKLGANLYRKGELLIHRKSEIYDNGKLKYHGSNWYLWNQKDPYKTTFLEYLKSQAREE